MQAELWGWEAEGTRARAARGAQELRKAGLAINPDVQYVRGCIGREFAYEFKLRATSDPARCADVRMSHDFASDVEQQACGRYAVARNGCVDVPPGVCGALQAQKR
jgi:hypothetical protein